MIASEYSMGNHEKGLEICTKWIASDTLNHPSSKVSRFLFHAFAGLCSIELSKPSKILFNSAIETLSSIIKSSSSSSNIHISIVTPRLILHSKTNQHNTINNHTSNNPIQDPRISNPTHKTLETPHQTNPLLPRQK